MESEIDSAINFVGTLNHPADSQQWFRVHWSNNTYPLAAHNCSSGCTVTGSDCMCDTTIVTEAVFVNSSTIPSKAHLLSNLSVGATDPACAKSADHGLIVAARDEAESDSEFQYRR